MKPPALCFMRFARASFSRNVGMASAAASPSVFNGTFSGKVNKRLLANLTH